jgi:hypothetical protein
MTIYENFRNEEKFAESLKRALHVIKSGMKVGADNLELILDDQDNFYLGRIVDVLNRCEIDYKQGKNNKLNSLTEAVNEYDRGNKSKLKGIFDKTKEIEDIQGWYMDAKGLLNKLDTGHDEVPTNPLDEDMSNFYANDVLVGDPAEDAIPPSITYRNDTASHKAVNDLHTSLEKKIIGLNVKEEHRNDLQKLKGLSEIKYAGARADLLHVLELYGVDEYHV